MRYLGKKKFLEIMEYQEITKERLYEFAQIYDEMK